MSKQNRIEGSYTIVSTYRNNTQNDNTMSAVRTSWSSGLSVALMVGVWLGEREESLMLSGLGHAHVGRKLALEYSQDAYIVVDSGLATLYIWNGHTFIVGNVWTKMLDRTSEDSYSIMPGGAAFVFAA